MKAGISTACMYPLATAKALDQLCRMGVKTTEVFVNTFSELDKNYIKERRRIADYYGTRILSLHPFTCGFEHYLFFTDYENRLRDSLELYKHYFEAAAILGAPYFVLHGDRADSTFPPERYFERYLKLRETGEGFSVTVLQENVWRFRSGDADFIGSMREALGAGVSFLLDLKQAVRAGQEPFRMLAAMGDRLEHIHASDHNDNDDCLPIGNGNFDFEKLASKLAMANYNGAVILELYRKSYSQAEELMTSHQRLTDIFSKAH